MNFSLIRWTYQLRAFQVNLEDLFYADGKKIHALNKLLYELNIHTS